MGALGLLACWPAACACRPVGLRLSPWAGAFGCRLLNRPSGSSPRPRALLTRNRFDPCLMPVRYLWGGKRPWCRLLSRRCSLWWAAFLLCLGGSAVRRMRLLVYRLRAMRTCTRAYRRIPKCTAVQQVCALRRPFWTVRPVQTKRHVEHYRGIKTKSKPTLGVFTKLLQL